MSDAIWIDVQSTSQIESLLREVDAIASDQRITDVQSAGEGNMNVTLRVTLENSLGDRGSLVVKQSRPFVAKYESIPAPFNRIHFEAEFYRFVSGSPALAVKMPHLISWIPEHHVLVLDDLGPASDATSLYSAGKTDALPDGLSSLLQWLIALHDCSSGTVDPERFANAELRALNHQHIFDLPFSDPPVIELDAVCSGLTQASQSVRSNRRLRQRCLELGEIYLSDSGTCLLHGDFYPGSWLLTDRGPYVIDPEFCFVGPPEFDVGVALAHLWLSGLDQADAVLYQLVADQTQSVSRELVDQFAAVEVLRRVLGVAQLPLSLDLDQRSVLVGKCAELLLG